MTRKLIEQLLESSLDSIIKLIELLVDHLARFFMSQLECVEGAAAYPWTRMDLKASHAWIVTDKTVLTEFMTAFATSLVIYAPDLTSTIQSYLEPYVFYFNVGSPAEICGVTTGSNPCDKWRDFVEVFTDDTTTAFNPTNITIYKSGTVSWVMGASYNLVNAASATATTEAATPLFKATTAANGGSAKQYKFDKVGTYYFYSAAQLNVSMRCTVTVLEEPLVALVGTGGVAKLRAFGGVTALLLLVLSILLA